MKGIVVWLIVLVGLLLGGGDPIQTSDDALLAAAATWFGLGCGWFLAELRREGADRETDDRSSRRPAV
ncbi:hypothetical protein [Conexibacter sp. SYSU D00693]|uniref:hypothetical protein n=1 Tax=Conexibacter sp. SYSU D00693 TaxID=2812560 RepID=UPI00196AD86B|nr:hypothetical protein [Conexibacter sp. SYSU D00693]